MAPPSSNYDSFQEIQRSRPNHTSTVSTRDESDYEDVFSSGNANITTATTTTNDNGDGSKVSSTLRSMSTRFTASSSEPPSNEYVLNVAFLSFVCFMGVQAFFALVANSESMLADSEAMSVDALTYLFNMFAERVKNRPPTPEELQLPAAVREHRVEMKRLYLELVPPMISVATLIAVTIGAMKEACGTLFRQTVADGGDDEGDDDDDVSAGLMLFFSGLNLLLDVLNVTCFARAHQAYGLQKSKDEDRQPAAMIGSSSARNYFQQHLEEAQALVEKQQQDDDEKQQQQAQLSSLALLQGSDMAVSEHATRDLYLESWFGNVNLNMCSAWTHICADTMRSLAVLVAAGIAFTFDSVSPAVADSCAAIAVSITILLSLIPLLRGLFVTARQIVVESKNKPAFLMET